MLGPFTTASRLTPIHQMSLAVLPRATCASMSTTTTTTTTTRDRADRYGPMEWAQKASLWRMQFLEQAIDAVNGQRTLTRQMAVKTVHAYAHPFSL